jgi:hypothetical protein
MPQTLSPAVSPDKPKLLEQVRGVIRRKHFSIRTEQAYTDWIRRFILFHGKRHPREMSEAEVTAFLTHLSRERNVAASTQNQAFERAPFSLQGSAQAGNRLAGRSGAFQKTGSASRGFDSR